MSQHYIDKHGLEMKKNDTLLKLADGNTAISRGMCDIRIECNKYCSSAKLRLMSLRMNPDFYIIL